MIQVKLNDINYDVVIAGGGMVGASLALLLSAQSDSKLKILVVERFPISSHAGVPNYSPSFDARSTALSYGSRLILEGLGIWPLLSQHIADISTVHVSEKGRFGTTLMDHQSVGWPVLGHVVENAWLGNSLMAALHQKANVTFMAPAKVADITPQLNQVELIIDQNEKQHLVRTQLAIIADGANSELSQKLGIQTRVTDYQQTALIANVGFDEAHNGCAYERFTAQGPLALLPLTDDELGNPRAALVWSLPHEEADHLMACNEGDFLSILQRRFGHRQGQFSRVGERLCYPLQLQESAEQVRSGLVIMGNAAHSIHPVAGQGFNLALRDCARLSNLLVEAYQHGEPLGDLELLEKYYQQQFHDQRKTIGFSDWLPALFNQQQFPVSLLRSMGLGLLDLTPTLKSEFIYQAAGLHDGAALG